MRTKYSLFSLAAIVFLLVNPAFAEDSPLDKLHTIAPDGYHVVEAQELGRPFYVFVRLPADYEKSDKRYPVIYLLDGGYTYPLLSSYYRMLSFDESMPEAILVGISYGGEGFADGNMRGTDFTAHSAERDFWGGAPAFQGFLADELLPFIAENYRTDEARRIIYGQSLGGQFLVYSAMTRPNLFWGRIASNPAFHRNLDYFLEMEPAAGQTDSHLIVTAASDEAAVFREPSQRWIAHWTEEDDLPFALHVIDLPGERHATATPLSFRAGMRVLFPDQPE
ncbi:alpha/beta hydrolase-fold protein [Hyphococcus flavus]|uniref:Alpha/beta hydrolase-fold protein n=1 Tax=Hyphococcus flavus TaxID=1866326 RepID=A0AAE9ZAE8_9PROT|nr:alpha/beta hydrolase-fold protein [Hyphococcus flavus]WDI30623.1 alpha/beta hydrolase-fold protein [Hyphococcus flavus]